MPAKLTEEEPNVYRRNHIRVAGLLAVSVDRRATISQKPEAYHPLFVWLTTVL